MPNMWHYTDSSERDKAHMLYKYLYEQVNDIVQELLTSVESAWDKRLYSVLIHAFNMVYQQATSLVDEIQYRKAGEIIRMPFS